MTFFKKGTKAMKRNVIKMLLTFVGLMTSAVAVAGDIYEIRPVDELNNTIDAPGSASMPLGSGRKLYFRLRLPQRDMANNNTRWQLAYNGTSIGTDAVLRPLQIGIYVSGQLTWATLHSHVTVDAPAAPYAFEDFIFTYQTKVGDMALPIRLATETGPINDASTTAELYFNPLSKSLWSINNAAGQEAEMTLWSPAPGYIITPPEADGNRVADMTLARCGFYVRTIDFDNKNESATIWRSVHEGSTVTGTGDQPSIVTVAGSGLDEERVMYLWSEDDTVVQVNPESGDSYEDVNMPLNGDGTLTRPTRVIKVRMSGGQSSANFYLKGIAEKATPVNIVLSPWPTYNYSQATGAGERLQDYLTVRVRCSEALPPTLMVTAPDNEVKASSEFLTSQLALRVKTSQAYTASDLTVTIAPKITIDGAVVSDSAVLRNYVRFSTVNSSVSSINNLTDTATVTIPAGSTAEIPVYAYFLRSDENTESTTGGITFEVESILPPEADLAYGSNKMGTTVKVTSKPEIWQGEVWGVDNKITTTTGEDTAIAIQVHDAYADMNASGPGVGYKVFVKYDGSAQFTQLPGFYRVGGGSILYRLDDAGAMTGNLPILKFPRAGTDLKTTIYVQSPISNHMSDRSYSFLADVEAARTATLTLDRDTNPVYNEGEAAKFTVTLSAPNDTGSAVYAFLKPTDPTIDLAKFSGSGFNPIVGMANPSGWPIANGASAFTGEIRLLDGLSTGVGGLGVTFQVVIVDQQNWDGTAPDAEDHVISKYSSTYKGLTVYNVEPTFSYMEMDPGGEAMEVDGELRFMTEVPKNMEVKFNVHINDPGRYDWQNTVEADLFTVRWTVLRGGLVVSGPTEKKGNPHVAANYFAYTPNQPGEYKIRAQIKDKDMDDWSETRYEVGFTVLNNPSIVITPSQEVFQETETMGSVIFRPSYWDPLYAGNLTVRVKVESESTSGTGDVGVFKLDSAYLVSGTTDEYELTFTDATPIELAVEELDGTGLSATKGWRMTATVTNDDDLPTSHEKANDYYKDGTKLVQVNNVAPNVSVTPVNNESNRWVVAAGPATSPIRFNLLSDVQADLDGKITFTLSGAGPDQVKTLTEPGSDSFTPDFTGMQGDVAVTLRYEDKDGGGAEVTYTYYYTVTATKTLTITPQGPAGASATNPDSVRYAYAMGLGQGRAFVADATYMKAQNFTTTWNCGTLGSVLAFGWGYKVGDVDNGSLAGGDAAIDVAGNNPDGKAVSVAANPYRYGDTERDSFLYRWLPIPSGNSDGGESPNPSPETKTASSVSIPLATEKLEEGGYDTTRWAVVFSKELYKEDNLGDINQDGVPDVFALREWGGGPLVTPDTDLSAVANSNPAQDRLPGIYTNPNNLNYGPVGEPFTVIRQIRGFHEGLNEQDVTTSEKSFSDDEAAACTAAGFDPATVTLAQWSPEPRGEFARMDPTQQDTDGDGFPDGWEYFFWYQAKVWVPAGTAAPLGSPLEGQISVFERFDINDITHGTPIDPAEVLAHFNPCSAMNDKIVDFDGDGLADLEELALGTNPCHWDTDGDGMSDAWENMMGLDPLRWQDRVQNPDNDFMAFAQTVGQNAFTIGGEIYVDFANEITADNLADGGAGVVTVVNDVHLTKVAHITPAVDGGGNPIVYGRENDTLRGGENFTGVWRWGRRMVSNVEQVALDVPAGTVIDTTIDYILVHDQVLTALGFDPRTAWMKNADGYVANRWNPIVNSSIDMDDTTGVAVNTEPYTNYDEYLVMNYRRQMGVAYGDDVAFDPTKVTETLQGYTTVPTIIKETVKEEDEEGNVTETEGDIALHGADTDGDGAPDGWELYMKRNPNQGPNAKSVDGSTGDAVDGDKLTLAQEYAGVDSCNAYQSCESIYQNHPGKKLGWWNKFFPTSPDEADTDGDTIPDGAEGAAWEGTFVNDGVESLVTLSFIYGENDEDRDDGLTTCFRGGGLNPLTVDTDLDGLPDAWERAYAGLPIDSKSHQYTLPGGSGGIEISRTTLLADGFNPDEATDKNEAAGDGTNKVASVVYLAGGMDATWNGDAYTTGETDPLIGQTRDLDFDHDGLQNYQEYLVQQIRAFRYDDAVTPLMGRMPTATAGGITVTQKGYVPMMQVADDFAALIQLFGYGQADIDAMMQPYQTVAMQAELGYEVTKLEQVWRLLGYMAPPIRAWDRMTLANKFSPLLMLPPQGASGYVTTSPMKADTDGDGMDDYWELFHGLNPLYGSVVSADQDVISVQYGGEITAYANKWMAADGVVAGSTAALNPVRYPWMMGASEVDADGDGIRNTHEYITANLTSPQAIHTDPTPIWFTDATSGNSYVSQYYLLTVPADMPFLPPVPMVTASEDAPFFDATTKGGAMLYAYPFEQNEGYDTDNDWRGDGREVIKTVRPTSDPQKFTDPSHRQALYLDGVDSVVMSREPQMRVVNAADLLLQFTVEAWVRPEDPSTAQTIIDRVSYYPMSNNLKDEGVFRSNFRLGIDSEGRYYGLFDNDDAVESGSGQTISSQIVTGPAAQADTWAHLALTFDGKLLSLYVNGEVQAVAATSLIPANGVGSVLQDPLVSIGDLLYTVRPSSFLIGARPVKYNAATAMRPLQAAVVQPEDLREYFKGYVDEVRVWDGACSSAEIAANYRVRQTFDTVATNRFEVYTHLLGENADSSRNDNDGLKMLQPELLQHYDFSTLPSAVNAADVSKTPSGFKQSVIAQLAEAPATFSPAIGWWNAAPMKNKVYDDYTVLPWVKNTVRHLPCLDGSSFDTHLYHSNLMGYYYSSLNFGLGQYTLNQSANPYVDYTYYLDRYDRLFKLSMLVTTLGDGATDANVGSNMVAVSSTQADVAAETYRRFKFDMRSGFVGTCDLIPLGGAFAKALPEMWDGMGASSVWEDTGVDTDGDGLPDWWEAMYGLDPNTADWNTLVDYDGMQIPAWQAYLRDLAKGMQPSGSVDTEYRQTMDNDGDGLVDWWQDLYNLKEGANGDEDGDGLSNYVEYLLSEVFNLGVKFDPTNAFSISPYVSDSFYRIGQMYVGEILTDHDRVSDQWEDLYTAKAGVSRYLYDAMTDADSDGWSNYAEFQAGTNPLVSYQTGSEEEGAQEYPVPVVATTLSYYGRQNIANKPIVVKAWSDPSLQTTPDAIWTIGSASEEGAATNGTTVVAGTQYMGQNPGGSHIYHLSPGHVVPGTVRVSIKDKGRAILDLASGQKWVPVTENTEWQNYLFDRNRNDSTFTGDLIYSADYGLTGDVIGSVNYVTGEMRLNYEAMDNELRVANTASAEAGAAAGTTVMVSDLARSYFSVTWASKPPTTGKQFTYYLGSANAPSEANNSLGRVKEGRNTFVAYCDLNGDGNYTAGEPYGAAYNVNVGWNQAEVSIALTDTHPVFARFKAMSSDSGELGTNDRDVIFGSDSTNLDPNLVQNTGSASGGRSDRIRIVRTLLNGSSYGEASEAIVLDKNVSVDAETYITEADFLNKGEFDVDWASLAKSLASNSKTRNLDVTSVVYRISIGNGPVNSNLVSLLPNRRFDSKDWYSKNPAQPLEMGNVVTTSPTLRWSIPGGHNTYTAFRVQMTGEDFQWDSGVQPMPHQIQDTSLESGSYYEWTPPLYVGGKTPDGTQIFENNKDYKWKIVMYNAKFHPDTVTPSWSKESTFRMSVMEQTTDVGALDVAVRYYGPDTVAADLIRVEAYTTPDFTGRPVAVGYVDDLNEIASANEITVGNAKLRGLKAGTYYVRAFIDTELDNTLAPWESWGYVCTRNRRDERLYTPTAVTVGPDSNSSTLVALYIDDSDTDQDNLPDAWEWKQSNGDLTALNTTSLDQIIAGFSLNTSLAQRIQEQEAWLSNGLSTRLMSLRSTYVAAMLMDIPVGTEGAGNAILEAASEVEGTVAITGLTLDSQANQVHLDVTTDLSTAVMNSSASSIYTFTDPLVNLVIWRKESLTDEDWTRNGSIPVNLGTVDQTISVDLPQAVDLKSGFYKVTVEKQ